mmetsp:Transcript_20891/g.27478  ORF Transcript_20891/g.27478 Transcript_20891/m.27478 type:complete len:95 (+) Transcript_20891:862-1146(+)
MKIAVPRPIRYLLGTVFWSHLLFKLRRSVHKKFVLNTILHSTACTWSIYGQILLDRPVACIKSVFVDKIYGIDCSDEENSASKSVTVGCILQST